MDEEKPQVQPEKIYDVSTPSDTELLEQELIQLRESVSKQEQSYVEQIRRLQADFENWRRRVEQEKTFLVNTASSVLAQKLLPVLDSFERALQAPPPEGQDRAFHEGMSLIFRQFCGILNAEGLRPVESAGKPFDPKLHEAYAYEERETGEDHVILEEARKGYRFKDQVIRPALVKVLRVSKKKIARDGKSSSAEEEHSGG